MATLDPLGVASVATPVIGGIINAVSNRRSNQTNLQIAREYNQTQKEIAAYQAQYNERMWNLQNEYNTPSAQMERFRAAGLNPNLIYGQGTSGNASSSLSYPDIKQTAPEVRPIVQDGLGVSQAVNNLQIAKSMQLDNTRKEQELQLIPYQLQMQQLQVFNESIKQTLLMQQEAKNRTTLKYLDDQLSYQNQAALQTIKNLVLQGDLLYQKMDLNEQANQRAWRAMNQRDRQIAIQSAIAMMKQQYQDRMLPGLENRLTKEIFKLDHQNSILAVEQKFQEEFGKDNANMFMKALGIAIQAFK